MLLSSPRPALQTGWLQEPETSDRPRPISRPSEPPHLFQSGGPSVPQPAGARKPNSPQRGIASLKIQRIRLTETACLSLCPNDSPCRAQPTNDQLGRHSTCKCSNP